MDVGLLQSALSPYQKQNVFRQKYILFTCELPVVNTVIWLGPSTTNDNIYKLTDKNDTIHTQSTRSMTTTLNRLPAFQDDFWNAQSRTTTVHKETRLWPNYE